MLIWLIAIKYFLQALNDVDQIQRSLSMLMIKHKETQIFPVIWIHFYQMLFKFFVHETCSCLLGLESKMMINDQSNQYFLKKAFPFPEYLEVYLEPGFHSNLSISILLLSIQDLQICQCQCVRKRLK